MNRHVRWYKNNPNISIFPCTYSSKTKKMNNSIKKEIKEIIILTRIQAIARLSQISSARKEALALLPGIFSPTATPTTTASSTSTATSTSRDIVASNSLSTGIRVV